MIKRFCDVCREEIPDSELYFDLTPERRGNTILGVTDDEELYVKPYIRNHAILCSECFRDVFLHGKYPSKAYNDKYYHGGGNK